MDVLELPEDVLKPSTDVLETVQDVLEPSQDILELFQDVLEDSQDVPHRFWELLGALRAVQISCPHERESPYDVVAAGG